MTLTRRSRDHNASQPRWAALLLPAALVVCGAHAGCDEKSAKPAPKKRAPPAERTTPVTPAGRRPPSPEPSIATLRRLASAVTPQHRWGPVHWPRGARVAVLLTFDVDAELAAYGFGRRPLSGPQQAVWASAGQFGIARGLARILEILADSGVRATFMVPGAVAELHRAAIRKVVASGHELGCHGYRHEDLQSIGAAGRERALHERCVQVLRRLGATVRGFRAPYRRLSSNTLRLVAQLGLWWDSTLSGDDVHPYRIAIASTEARLIELPIAATLDDWALFGAPLSVGPLVQPDSVLRLWKRALDAAWRERGLLTLVMHPQVIGRADRISVLRGIIAHGRTRGAWFARASDAVDYLRDDKRSKTAPASQKSESR